MIHIVPSHQQNNSSCPLKTPLWRLPYQLETQIQLMKLLYGKSTPINVLSWLYLAPYLHCVCWLQLQAQEVVIIYNHPQMDCGRCSGTCRLSSWLCQLSTHQRHFWHGCCFWKWRRWDNKQKKEIEMEQFIFFYLYSLTYNLYILPSFIDIWSRASFYK